MGEFDSRDVGAGIILGIGLIFINIMMFLLAYRGINIPSAIDFFDGIIIGMLIYVVLNLIRSLYGRA